MLAAAHGAGLGIRAEKLLLLRNRVEGVADLLAAATDETIRRDEAATDRLRDLLAD